MGDFDQYLRRTLNSATRSVVAPTSGGSIRQSLAGKARGRLSSLPNLKEEAARKAVEQIEEKKELQEKNPLYKSAEDLDPAPYQTDFEPPKLAVQCEMVGCLFNRLLYCSKEGGPIIASSENRGVETDSTMCSSYVTQAQG